MHLEAVTVGTELLLGFTIDTNAAEIGRQLGAVGVRVVRRTSVADDAASIRDAVRDALARTGAVLITGGLGPTRDDITKHTVAELFGAELEFDPAVWEAVLARFAKFRRPVVQSNRSQAMVPRGAEVLPNQWGTAPGLWLEGTQGLVIMLPGVPGEMRGLLEHEVVPRLARRAGDGRVVRSRTVRTTAIAESTLAERLGEIEREIAPLTLAYLPGIDGVDLRVTSWEAEVAEADLRLAVAVDRLRKLAGNHAYGEDDADLAAEVLTVARQKGLHIAVAESCTGGLLGGRLTAVPGSSSVFKGGTIAYDNDVKIAQLGVAPETLKAYGAVSEECARGMAEGAAARFATELAIAVTGIAGPDGGSADKPVGTVCFASLAGGETRSWTQILGGERAEIRARAAQVALFQLLRRLSPD